MYQCIQLFSPGSLSSILAPVLILMIGVGPYISSAPFHNRPSAFLDTLHFVIILTYCLVVCLNHSGQHL